MFPKEGSRLDPTRARHHLPSSWKQSTPALHSQHHQVTLSCWPGEPYCCHGYELSWTPWIKRGGWLEGGLGHSHSVSHSHTHRYTHRPSHTYTHIQVNTHTLHRHTRHHTHKYTHHTQTITRVHTHRYTLIPHTDCHTQTRPQSWGHIHRSRGVGGSDAYSWASSPCPQALWFHGAVPALPQPPTGQSWALLPLSTPSAMPTTKAFSIIHFPAVPLPWLSMPLHPGHAWGTPTCPSSNPKPVVLPHLPNLPASPPVLWHLCQLPPCAPSASQVLLAPPDSRSLSCLQFSRAALGQQGHSHHPESPPPSTTIAGSPGPAGPAPSPTSVA